MTAAGPKYRAVHGRVLAQAGRLVSKRGNLLAGCLDRSSTGEYRRSNFTRWVEQEKYRLGIKFKDLLAGNGREGVMRYILTLFAVAVLWAIPVSAQDLQRGLANYRAIISGQKTFQSLSPTEQYEVQYVINLLQSRDDSGSSDRRDAKDRARNSSSELANYANRLKRCAEANNFNDDCYSEFRRTRSAHGDYESAVSSVRSYCN